MITLITGAPGSGKTLSVVSDLAKKLDSEYKDRKIFIDGINELTIDTTPIPSGHTIQDMDKWLIEPEYNGSVVIIDEAQRIFPPRSSNSKPSSLVEFMHVHRHFGLDIILITQMPQRIDKQVRDLIGAHYHIHKNSLGFRVKYYWDYCANNPKSESSRGQKTVYRLDSKAFKLYKSAQVHTKIKQPKSKILYVIPIALLAFTYFSYQAKKAFSVEEQESQTVQDSSPAINSQMKDAKEAVTQVRSLNEDLLKPMLPNHPESKPLYDSVRQVQSFEYPVACISGGKSGCSCYSEQGTKLKEIDLKTCKTYVAEGVPFNPYRQRSQQQEYQPSPPSPTSSIVLELDGHSALTLNNEKFGDAPEAQ